MCRGIGAYLHTFLEGGQHALCLVDSSFSLKKLASGVLILKSSVEIRHIILTFKKNTSLFINNLLLARYQ